MRKALKRALLILLIAAVLSGLALGGMRLYQKHYVNLNGVSYPKYQRILDLSGRDIGDLEGLLRFEELRRLDVRRSSVTPEEYEWLCRELPKCKISWDLPFQGDFLDRETRTLTLTSLTGEEVELLDYLPSLTLVEAWDCPDTQVLVALRQRRPECQVLFYVPIGGERFDCDASQITLWDLSDPQVREKLEWLPRLEKVRLEGTLPKASVIRELTESFPEVEFSWSVQVGSDSLDCRTEVLDLTGLHCDSIQWISGLIRYFPQLRELRLGATDLPEEALLALEKGEPQLFIVWDMEVEGVPVSRDARELDISGRTVRDLGALEARLLLMPKLERMVMCGCGLSSEEMDALDRRHEQIRFIWSVDLGGLLLRTDAVYFAPNKYAIKVTDWDIRDLQYCYDMVCVDIGHMRGVTHCQWAANMPKLKYLVIGDTNIRDLSPLSGLQELVFLEAFTAPIRDYKPLLQCPALEDLNLGYTYGDPTPVMEMTWLKRLWWPGSLHVLNWNVRNQLRTCLPDTKMNFVAGSSTGEGWREGKNYYDMRDLLGMDYMTG